MNPFLDLPILELGAHPHQHAAHPLSAHNNFHLSDVIVVPTHDSILMAMSRDGFDPTDPSHLEEAFSVRHYKHSRDEFNAQNNERLRRLAYGGIDSTDVYNISEGLPTTQLLTEMTEREIVRAAAAIHYIQYDFEFDDHYDDVKKESTVFEPIYAKGHTLFGTSGALAETNEMGYNEEQWFIRQKELVGEHLAENEDDWEYYMKHDPESLYNNGKSAGAAGVTYSIYEDREGNQMFNFRGSYTDGDYNIVLNWMNEWYLEKAGAWSIDAWEKTGHTVSSEMKGRTEASLPTECAWRLATPGLYETNADVLYEGLKGTNLEVSKDDVRKKGMWELTKKIVRKFLPEDRDKESEKLTVFTGHSQGGARANLVSMWLEKQDDFKYKSIAIAPLGLQCWTREMSPHMNEDPADLLDDLDPYVFHDQCVSYLHPLDLYAGSDFQPGRVCEYGNTLLGTDRPGGKDLEYWFEKIVGFPGYLVTTPDLDPVPFYDFRMSRYWTHSISFANMLFSSTEFLAEDGTTDGGCYDADIIPENDPDGQCPTGTSTQPMCMVLLLSTVFGAILRLVGCCCCGCFVGKCGPFKKKVQVAADGGA
jgi:hypothetical protein